LGEKREERWTKDGKGRTKDGQKSGEDAENRMIWRLITKLIYK
jgi:hypothetical protein